MRCNISRDCFPVKQAQRRLPARGRHLKLWTGSWFVRQMLGSKHDGLSAESLVTASPRSSLYCSLSTALLLPAPCACVHRSRCGTSGWQYVADSETRKNLGWRRSRSEERVVCRTIEAPASSARITAQPNRCEILNLETKTRRPYGFTGHRVPGARPIGKGVTTDLLLSDNNVITLVYSRWAKELAQNSARARLPVPSKSPDIFENEIPQPTNRND